MFLAQLLRALPAASLNDRPDHHVVIARWFDVKLVGLGRLLKFRFLLIQTRVRRSHDDCVEHAENLGLEYRNEVF